MIKIKRVKTGKYELYEDGEKIATYDKIKMKHPDDWIDDVDISELHHGWRYTDERNE